MSCFDPGDYESTVGDSGTRVAPVGVSTSLPPDGQWPSSGVIPDSAGNLYRYHRRTRRLRRWHACSID